MKRRFSFRFVCCSAVMALVLGLCAAAKAGPLDDRVPADAIIYAGWAGSDALAPQYAQSNLKNIIDASSMQKFIEDQLPKLIEQASANDPEAKKNIEMARMWLDLLWRHPTAFYFCPIDFTNPQQPVFRFGLMSDAGTDAKAAADGLKKLLADNPPTPELTVNVVQDGNVVILTFGKADTAESLKANGGLKAAPAYIKAMAQVKGVPTPAIAAYLDAQKLLATIDDALVKIPAPAADKDQVKKVIDALGVRGLTQGAVVSGFGGKGWMDASFIGTAGPRTGILALLDSPPVSNDSLAVVPKDASMMSASAIDLMKLYAEVRAVAGKIDPSIPGQIDDAIKQANAALGVDVVNDLAATLGNDWVMYRAPMGDAGAQFALVNKLKNADKFAATLATLEQQFNDKAGSPIKVEKVKVGGSEVSTLAFLTYNICWTVKDGYLFVSTLDGITGAIAQVEKKAPSIATSDNYIKAMAKIPAGIKPSGIAYGDPAKTYPELRTLALGIIPMLRGQGINVPMDILPDPAAVSQFMTPGVTVAWTDADGIHMLGTSAFPGAALASGGGMSGSSVVAVAAMGAAVALPSLGRARELAVSNADAANLRGIAQSCIVWDNANDMKMPDHLARLLQEGQISPRSLVKRATGTMPLDMPQNEMEKAAKEDFAKFSALVNQHCDYAYLGRGTTENDDPEIVLAYDKPSAATTDGINVAFCDGHVEFVRWANVPKTFGATNAFLKKAGQPTVDVNAMMKLAPTGVREIAPAPGRGAQLP